jgi:hypothetical protein
MRQKAGFPDVGEGVEKKKKRQASHVAAERSGAKRVPFFVPFSSPLQESKGCPVPAC